MNPNQQQYGPPQSPPPTDGGYPPSYNPEQQYSTQPDYNPNQQQYSPPQSYTTAAQPNPYAQPTPPQQAPENWYTPQPKPEEYKPGDVSQYLQQANSQAPQNPATGQTINGQYAVDYLGGIAPVSSQNTISIAGFQLTKKVLFFGIGIVAMLFLAILLMIFSKPPEGPTTLSESSMYANLVDTADITKDSKKNIKGSKLRAFNGSLQTFLINAATQMEDPLTKSGLEPSKLRSEAKKPPYHDEKMAGKLEEARLLNTYDRVYATEVGFKLDTIAASMEKIKKTNTRESMQNYLKQIDPSLKTLQKALKEQAESGAI